MQHLVNEQSLNCLAVPAIDATPPNKTVGILEQRSDRLEGRLHSRESLQIELQLDRGKATVPSHTIDISVAGLSLICEINLLPGTPLRLRFCVGGTAYLHLVGQVIFCRPSSSGAATGYVSGIKFAALREWDRALLVSAIVELTTHGDTLGQSFLSVHISEDSLGLEAAGIAVHTSRALEDWSIPPRRSCMHAAKITGWGSYLPEQEISNQEISARVNAPGYKNVGEVIETLTGIKSRRYENPERYPSDLAAAAAMEALNNAGMDATDLDVIIFFGISRDFHEPATANVVQEKIGAKNAYVYDLANACNGFITAVDTLDSMIASGRCENGLVVTGELISPYIDWDPKTKKDFRLSIFSYTIGDSGGAAVLSRVRPEEKRGIQARWFLSAGSHWRLALAGELKGANAHNKYFKSEGREMETLSYDYMPIGFQEITRLLGWSMADIDLVIPHQIPVSILENTYHKAVGIPLEKLYWTFPKYGNLATASMPVAMCEAMKHGRVRLGDKVLFAGGAAGFSAGYIGVIV